MSKFKELKNAIANPPPERLAKTEYQSHFLQILGVLIVCAILIYKGYWYIIFAFVFSIGVSYSQGISAYQRYHAIRSLQGHQSINPETEKSPTRRRGYIVSEVFGLPPFFISILTSIAITYFIVGDDSWYQKTAFVFVVIFFHLIIYYFIIYWIANYFYKRRKKND